jgi:hypothetical protein
VPSPALNQLYNEFYGVSATLTSDVWAVGYAQHGSGLYGSEKTLIEHWNGAVWSIVRSPNIGTKANFLRGVAAVSATDAWAVGLGNSSSAASGQALAMHWDASRWKLARTPSLGSGLSELYGIRALSSSDVWAVGEHAGATLVEHWDGATWTMVPSVDGASGDSTLFSISGTSSSDLGAVGASGNKTLTEHWDGFSWSLVSSPNGSLPVSQLAGVTAFGASDVWAVGFTANLLTVTFRTLTMHWDGLAWTIVPSPNPGPEYDGLSSVAGIASGDVWAVGNADEGTLALVNADG